MVLLGKLLPAGPGRVVSRFSTHNQQKHATRVIIIIIIIITIIILMKARAVGGRHPPIYVPAAENTYQKAGI